MASIAHALLADKPKVPRFKKVDFGEESADALAENQKNLPAAAAFADQINRLSGEQLNAALERMLPGYASIRDKATGNISSLMRGELPEDVQARIERLGAERGVSTGTAGSKFGDVSTVRSLGLTSLDLSQRGLDSAMRWLDSAASRTPIYNIANAFIPVQQRVGIRAAENQFQFQRDWLKSQVDAIPEGWEAAVITLADNIEAVGRSVLTAYAGGAVGGMGSGGGGGGGTTSGAFWGAGGSTPSFSGGASVPPAPAQPSYYGGMSLNGAGAAWGSPYAGGGSAGGVTAPYNNFTTGGFF